MPGTEDTRIANMALRTSESMFTALRSGLSPSLEQRPALFAGSSLGHDSRCDHPAKNPSQDSECQAIVETPSCLGKSNDAVSSHDAHPSRPAVNVGATGRAARNIFILTRAFPTNRVRQVTSMAWRKVELYISSNSRAFQPATSVTAHPWELRASSIPANMRLHYENSRL